MYICWTDYCKGQEGSAMKRIISALVVSSLLLAGQVYAAAPPDAIVFEGGDVRIKGTGNGLVFPNGSRQTVAADGISKSVHGTVTGASVPNPGTVTGTGFSVSRTTLNSVGSYDITFSSAFSSTPDCVVSAAGHLTNINTQNGYVACEVTAISVNGATVECRNYRPLAALPTLIDTTFTFICVD
jgi:hypothetical protein